MSFSTSSVSAPGTNAAAVVTYDARAGRRQAISGVAWSYDATPTGGNLTIQDGADVVFTLDITSAGPGFIPYENGQYGTVGRSLTITLTAGGAGIKGKLCVLDHWQLR